MPKRKRFNRREKVDWKINQESKAKRNKKIRKQKININNIEF